MKKFMIFFISFSLLWNSIYIYEANAAVITKTGTVTVDDLNVRTGAGTNNPILQVNGSAVKLAKGTIVTLNSEDNKWYNISFSLQGKTYKGYVLANYISANPITTTSKLPLNIPVVLTSKQYIKTTASKKVALKVKTKAQILSEKNVSGVRWYKISFVHQKETKQGYVLASGVKLLLKKTVKAKIASKKEVKIQKKAGNSKTYLTYKNKVISLKNAIKVTIKKEVTVKKIKWYQVKFTYKKKTFQGYIPANKILFIVKTKTEEVPVATTPTPTLTPTSIPVPTATPAPTISPDFETELANQGFPESYKSHLRTLHLTYPNWRFVAFKTGIDWNTAVAGEYGDSLSATARKNLISNSKASAWKSFALKDYDRFTNIFTKYDGSDIMRWVAAAPETIAYYMDPRNFLDDDNTDPVIMEYKSMFQFELLEYQSAYQTKEGVEYILAGTPMANATYSYIDEATGQPVTKYYSDTFMEVAQTTGVSPYHLASRVKQEVLVYVNGTASLSSSASGTVSGFEGLYNFFNIGASDSATGDAVTKGLFYAGATSADPSTNYSRPWNNPYKSILGGAQFIGKNYINRNKTDVTISSTVNTGQQNTLYLQKFNVTSLTTYGHQYMSNVEAPYAESLKTYTAYKSSIGTMPFVFSIPVYDNMPEAQAPAPVGDSNNYLRDLAVDGYSFVEGFNANSDNTAYTLYVDNTVMNVNISAISSTSSATLLGTGVKKLTNGTNIFNITVTAQNGAVRIYTITMIKNQ